MQNILDQKEEAILADERRVLANLRVILAGLEATSQDQATLEHCIAQLDELFSLVIVGEFNSGKSAVANALLGRTLLEEGVTPTTTRIHVLKYGSSVESWVSEANVGTLTAPLEVLRRISIVDTPGTNAIYREHEAITQSFVPRSDIVLFVTSADRPFTESERLFLQSIREWGKKIVFVINKTDILETPEQVSRIETFIADNATALLGVRPEIFPVSARQALRAKENGDTAALAESRFSALEGYIVTTLDEEERLRLKLMNPIGVGRHLVQMYRQKTEDKLELLSKDLSAIADIEWKLSIYKEEMGRQFRYRLAEIDNCVQRLEERGTAFLDDAMRLPAAMRSRNAAALAAAYDSRVADGAAAALDESLSDLVDWLLASELRQRQAIIDYLSQRRLDHASRIVTAVEGGMKRERARLNEAVGKVARDVVQKLDQRRTISGAAADVRRSVGRTAVLEGVVAAGGAVAAVLANTLVADVAAVGVAALLAVLGLAIVPARRRRARAVLRADSAGLREDLAGALSHQLDEEIERSVSRINDAVSPYTSFVRAESGYWTTPRDALTSTGRELIRLQARVEAL
jgi:small GTP-binding protein